MISQSVPASRKIGKGRIIELGLTDLAVRSQLAAYKARIAGSYRAVLPEDIENIPVDGWLSPKIDGELWFLFIDGHSAWLANARGTTITGDVAIINEAIKIAAIFDGKIILAGELHANVDGRRCRVGDVAAALKSQEIEAIDKIAFSAFDILQAPGEQTGYSDRLDQLNDLIKASNNLKIVDTRAAQSHFHIKKVYEDLVSSGLYEGLIIRSRDGMIYKIKPSHTIDAVVLGYTVKSDAPDRVRSILLGLIHPDQSVQIWGACGNIGSDGERKALFDSLQGIIAASNHRYASETGGLYIFVKPEIVVEIRVSDLQAEKSDGTPINTMSLLFDGRSWSSIKQNPNASPIHPVLVRIRHDKSADSVDVRIAQIADWLSASPDNEAISVLPKSDLIRREVWTKESKGKLAVRKLLVWRTNKSSVSSLYPEYVIHWTDYSSGRGTPLDREVRLAMNEETAFHIADTIIAENIKKGWEKR